MALRILGFFAYLGKEGWDKIMDITGKLENRNNLYQNTTGNYTKTSVGKEADNAFAKQLEGTYLSTEELIEQVKQKRDEIYEKLQNGETEESFVIGAGSYTIREWDSFIKQLDKTIDEAKEEMRAEIQKRKEDQIETEEQREEELEKEIEKRIDMEHLFREDI